MLVYIRVCVTFTQPKLHYMVKCQPDTFEFRRFVVYLKKYLENSTGISGIQRMCLTFYFSSKV